MVHVIKTQISNHPIITTNSSGGQIKRFVQCTGYTGFDLEIEHVVLRFKVTLESPEGTNITTPMYLEYKLHTNVWFNAQGEVVDSNSPDAVITEYDYWMGTMIYNQVIDNELIMAGILNLDQNFQFFNQI